MARIFLLLLLGMALSEPGAAQSQPEPYGGPIIDMHLHGERGTSMQDWEGALQGLEVHGVVRAALSVDDTASVRRQANVSERFLIGPAFPCYDGRFPKMDPCFEEGEGWPDLDWLRAEYESGRLQTMGEMLYVYYGILPTDERLAPYWALAEELDIPVGVHTGRGPPPQGRAKGCCPYFNDDLGNPSLLEPILQRHPNLRLWLMHAPGWDYVDEAIALMQGYPNVYAEMAIVNSIVPPAMHEAALRAVVKAGLVERIMFGSDNVPIGPIVERIEAVPFLSEEQKRAIFYGNAARFLGLSAEEIARHHGK